MNATRRHIRVCAAMLALLCALLAVGEAAACTSAVISGKLTPDGRPLLWKNRDTSHASNFVARHEATDSTCAYVALYNHGDSLCREAWIGVNDRGFAIMNTQSYNLAPDTAAYRDREGYVMADALRRCHAVTDFATMLDTMARPMGVQANFGVIDAHGAGGYFEVNDEGYTFYPIDDAHPMLVRSNFSESGTTGGLGLVRYSDACTLLAPHADLADITPELLTDTLSRSFYLATTDSDDSMLDDVVDRGEYIPRYSTSASVVVKGINADGCIDDIVMWTVLGYPPCSVAYPATLSDIHPMLALGPESHAPAWLEAEQLRQQVFHRVNGDRHIRMDLLRRISAEKRRQSLNNYYNFNHIND